MIIRIMTLFPQMFEAPLGTSILQRARQRGLLDIACMNIRDYADNKHKKVDDYPYGGGPGMVMTPQPIYDCHQSILKELSPERPRTIYLSPKGRVFDQNLAAELASEGHLIFFMWSL